MNFGKIFERRKIENASKNMEEIYKIKAEIEKEDKIFDKELPTKYALLQEFSMGDLEILCSNLLGREPPIEEYDDQSGNKKTLPRYKEDYIHFITDELRLEDIKKFALENKIVSKEFFNQT